MSDLTENNLAIDANNVSMTENNDTNQTDEQMNQSNQTNGESNSNEQNVDNDNDNDDNLDIYRAFYGESVDNEDNEEEEEDICYYNDDNDENDAVNTETLADTDTSLRKSTVINSNNKRLSSDDDENVPIKKIKTEPEQSQTKVVENVTKLTTRIEMSTDVEIPDNTQKFMIELLNWDSNCLEYTSADKQIAMSSNLLDITDSLYFKEYRFYRDVFIPYILCDLWHKITQISSNKHNRIANGKPQESKHLLSILAKFKSKRLTNGLELKCIFMRRAHLSSQFKFGQLVTLRTAVQLKPNSNAHIITRNCYFGYVVNHTIRESNKQNQSEVNHMRLISESKRDFILVEEVTFLMKYVDEIYKRNDALILAEPIMCVHNYHLQARSLYKFEAFPQSKQILEPVFHTKPSGIMREASDDSFTAIQLDAIQTCLDVVACASNSRFVAIYGSVRSVLRKTLVEIIKQIIFCKQFEATKILFTAPNNYNFGYIIDSLNFFKIKTFFVSDDSNKANYRSIKKHIEHKLTKDAIKLDAIKKRQYEECLKYYETGGEHELSVECVLLNNSICDQVNNDLMKLSKVIIGRIDDICNDIAFYKAFTNNNNNFNCCIIDDAINVTETQMCALLWFGVSKFILTANTSKSRNDDCDRFTQLCLTRSFFERYNLTQPQQLPQFRTIINLD